MCSARYISWVGALQTAYFHIGRHLGFCQKLEITKKWRKLEIVNASHVKYDIIKHFSFHLKKAKKQFYPKMA